MLQWKDKVNIRGILYPQNTLKPYRTLKLQNLSKIIRFRL